MDNRQLGNNIAKFRREMKMTQDQLAEMLAVSPQAVSKWENDVSYPDIELLPKLADIFGVTIDRLFSNEQPPETSYMRPEERKDPDKMLFKINVLSRKGDKVKVNLPVALLKVLDLQNMDENDHPIKINGLDLKAVDWQKIFMMIEQGVIGKLIEVESADGDYVEVFVE
ncbi:MAG TPA: helix-turn-helix domain-containing protein [Fastidiosipila sp.]|nr:helix-turn-helix domain-containing protein [Fastidiosipila sp.]